MALSSNIKKKVRGLRKKNPKLFSFLKNSFYSIENIRVFLFFELKLVFLNQFSKKMGITSVKRKVPIIVNTTSIPPRLSNVHLAVEQVFQQSLKPDRVILWLCKKYRNPKFKDFDHTKLPKKLLNMKKRGLEIRFVKDVGPHTKIVPALSEFSDCIIVSMDDDSFYHKDVLKNFYDYYKKHGSEFAYCRRAISVKKTSPKKLGKYVDWIYKSFYGHDKSFLCESASGQFFPPNFFSKRVYKIVIDDKVFSKLSKYNDDIWMYCMTLLDNKSFFNIEKDELFFRSFKGSQKVKLADENIPTGRNDIQIKNVFDKFNLYKKLD